MHVVWQIVTRSVTVLKVSIFTTALLTGLVAPMIASPIAIKADTNCGTPGVALSGSSWLTSIGGAVNVCNHPGDGSNSCVSVSGAPADPTHCNNVAGLVWAGTAWQCVELLNRLYLTKGWTTATWYGDGGGSNSISNSNHLLSGLTAQGQGAISYINPGDAVSLDYTQDPAGHVGIFDHTSVVSGVTEYNLINQNAQLNSSMYIPSTGGSLSGGNASFSMNAWLGYTVRAVVHHPNTSLRSIPTSDGNIQLFKISNGALSENWYSPVYGTNGNWTQPVAMPSTPNGTPTVVARSGQSVIDAFVRGSDNHIYETWYNWGTAAWGGWINLGGTVTSDPQAQATSDGHDQVFGTGNNLVQQNWFSPTYGTMGNWITSVGLSANAVGSPALVARSGQNVIDEFVRGGNNQIYETWYNFQYGNWGGWIGMGGTVTSDPQAVATSDGHDQVFGTGNNLVQQNWFSPTYGTMGGGWTTSPGLLANALGSPAVVSRTGQSVIDEFVRGGDNQVHETWYDWNAGGWGGWINMGGTVTSDPQGQATPDNHDQIFGTNNNLVQQNWFSIVDGSIGQWKSF